jgi:cellulose synthase (UDP-forming)
VPAHVAARADERAPLTRREARRLRQLPKPPTEQEKYQYMLAKKRWVLIVQALAFLLIVFSTVRFVQHIKYTEVFLVPLLISIGWSIVSFATTFPSRRQNKPSHDLMVAQYAPARWPSVDVFLPSAGESLDVLYNTYTHVSALQWTGLLRVVVLDDSARVDVEYMAAQFGFVYLSRPDRGRLKKAGNLLYGYQRSRADFIAIFDADFAPRADFLRETLPYFAEENGGRDVGIVQTPQYFDADNSMSWLQRAAGSGQEYFYRWVQPGRDRSNGAICVGTNAVYRRKALERSGGFAQIGHSEDVHTGVNMNKVGYFVRYVPVILAKGLCPDELENFINQQYRWCAGSMSLLFDRNFHRTPMPLQQRLCFWSGFLYYISTGLAVFWGPLPPIIMGLFNPQYVKPRNYALVSIAVIIWFLIHPIISSGRGRRIGVARVQLVYSFAHIRALWDIARDRPADWVPSGLTGTSAPKSKGVKMYTKVRVLMVSYLVATQLGLWAAIAWHAPEYGWNNYWPMAFFAFTNLLLILPLIHGRLKLSPFEAIMTEDYDAVQQTFQPHPARSGTQVISLGELSGQVRR